MIVGKECIKRKNKINILKVTKANPDILIRYDLKNEWVHGGRRNSETGGAGEFKKNDQGGVGFSCYC